MKYIKSTSIILTVFIVGLSCQSQENVITEEEAKLFCDKVEVMYNDASTETAKEILVALDVSDYAFETVKYITIYNTDL